MFSRIMLTVLQTEWLLRQFEPGDGECLQAITGGSGMAGMVVIR